MIALEDIELTKQLRAIKSSLQNLNDNWNPAYWIYVASGTLCLMKHDKNGKRAMLPDGGYDLDYEVGSYGKIEADGGDW